MKIKRISTDGRNVNYRMTTGNIVVDYNVDITEPEFIVGLRYVEDGTRYYPGEEFEEELEAAHVANMINSEVIA
tara:strand:+ start:1069 stop:1290 length:222 start_codon:yes stop_codon:yes gene_type:complete